MITADYSCRLVEIDFAGIEQVLMGWFMRDPRYIRIAKLGTHALVAAAVLGREHELLDAAGLPRPGIAPMLKAIKSSEHLLYDRCKRTVHGTAYGLTPYGMVENFPETFPTLKTAQHIQDIYFRLAPGVPIFHKAVRQYAYDHGYLGGPGEPPFGHPYGYKHWFNAVIRFAPITESQRLWRQRRKMPVEQINGMWYGVELGEDAKRVIAYYPQSTGRGVLTEAAFELFDPESPTFIGDAYFGRTPLRAPIHDSLLLEVPVRALDRVIPRVFAAMMRPIEELPCPPEWGLGEALTIGVEGKIGKDWSKDAMEELPAPSAEELGLSGDSVFAPEDDEAEEAEGLSMEVA